MRPKPSERVPLQRFRANTPDRLGSVVQRTKDEEEIWLLSVALRALNDLSHLSDAWITHREKPDFLLELTGLRIGIEVTEAIGESTARKRREFAKRENHAPEQNVQWMEQYHPERRPGGWVGYSERQVASQILERLESKAKRAKDYERFDEFWIVVCQNTFVPDPDPEIVLNFLRKSLRQEILDAFDWAIVVDSGTPHTIFGGSKSPSLTTPG